MKISIIIWAKGTKEMFFRDCLNSIMSQTYRKFEVVVIDDSEGRTVQNACEEIFAHDGRLHYYRLKSHKGMAYALNIGLQRRSGRYAFFMGQHDRISDDALARFKKTIEEEPGADLIYSDRDEIVGAHRRNPAFLPGFNVELLRHTNYIGENFLVSVDGLKKTGILNENLEAAAIYDLLLKVIEKKLKVIHIPRLLYHVRVLGDMRPTPALRQVVRGVYREHMTVVSAHLRRMEILASVEPDKTGDCWRINYDGQAAASHRGEFLVVREKGVSIRQSHFTERLYGILRQKDVGIVGVRFEKARFVIDNCGYIFDERGIVYPACHNQTALSRGYMDRAILPHDVSMVDSAMCLIDKKALEKCGGFDKRLKGRALMLDLCFKMRSVGRRVVFDPAVVARKKKQAEDNASSEKSNALLLEKWEDRISKGDPYYNRNLPMGLQNYLLYQ